MKKYLVFATILAFFMIISLPAQAQNPMGKIINITGRVDITRQGRAAVPAKPGDPLMEKDIIRTKSKSKAEIRFKDGSIMRMDESTRVEITKYMIGNKKRDSEIKLFRGKIQNIVRKALSLFGGSGKNRFEVRTPTAVIGVRGTNFFTYHKSGISGAVFIEGLGYCYSLNRPEDIREIRAGEAMSVINPFSPPVIRPVSDMEIQKHIKKIKPEKQSPSEKEDMMTRGKEDEKEKIPLAEDFIKNKKSGTPTDNELIVMDDENPDGDQEGTLPFGDAKFKAKDEKSIMESDEPEYFGGDGEEVGDRPHLVHEDWKEARIDPDNPDLGDNIWMENDHPGFSDEFYNNDGNFNIDDQFFREGNFQPKPYSEFDPDSVSPAFETEFEPRLFESQLSSESGQVKFSQVDFLSGMFRGFFARDYMEDSTPWNSASSMEVFLWPSASPTDYDENLISSGWIFFTDKLSSYNHEENTITTFDGGVFKGFLTGSGLNLDTDGLFLALAMNPQGQLGILSGTFSGGYNYLSKEFRIPGEMRAFIMSGRRDIFPENFNDRIKNSIAGWEDISILRGNFITSSGEKTGKITGDDFYAEKMGFEEEPWGLMFFAETGKFVRTGDKIFDRWQLSVSNNKTGWKITRLFNGTENAEGKTNGTGLMQWVDTNNSLTGIGTGTHTGSFDRAQNIWQNVQTWTWMETEKFAFMTKDPMGIDILNDLNIPSVEIGKTNLTGKDDIMSLSMDDVIFFSYPSGGPDSVWYSRKISGNFTSQPKSGHVVHMSGDNIKANFKLISWKDNMWSAELNNGEGRIGPENGKENNIYSRFSGYLAGFYSGSSQGEIKGEGAGLGFTNLSYNITSQYESEIFAPIFRGNMYDDAYRLFQRGFMEGNLSGNDSLWTASMDNPASFSITGSYFDDGSPDNENSIWYSNFFNSFNFTDNTPTTFDGGAFMAVMGGRATENETQGYIVGLYADPSGKTGIIKGSVAGTSDSESEEFKISGETYPINLDIDKKITNTSFDDFIYVDKWNGEDIDSLPKGQILDLSGDAKGEISPDDIIQESLGYMDESWWLSLVASSGTYESENESYPARFQIPLEKKDGQKWLREFNGVKSGENAIKGSVHMAWVDINQALTGVGGGEFTGTFDPNQYTWKTIEILTALETGKFMEMTKTESGKQALAALNIPAMEIGRANLSGHSDKLKVNMNDVIFFSYRTGGDPKIWATNNVSGEYMAIPEKGHLVNLEGAGLSADMKVMSWDDNKWAAEINGSGVIKRTDINSDVSTKFAGHAAGPYQGDSSGSFTGTGAGIARAILSGLIPGGDSEVAPGSDSTDIPASDSDITPGSVISDDTDSNIVAGDNTAGTGDDSGILPGRDGDGVLPGGDGDGILPDRDGDGVLPGGDGDGILPGGDGDGILPGGDGDGILPGGDGDGILPGGDGPGGDRGSRLPR